MSFGLYLYSVDESKITQAPSEEDINEWLTTNGTVLGEPISFEETECYSFFKAIYILTDCDLLPLIGSSVDEPSNDDEYCSGTVANSVLDTAKNTLQTLDKSHLQCAEFLQSQGVSTDWFLDSLNHFIDLLAIAGTNRIFGYFE